MVITSLLLWVHLSSGTTINQWIIFYIKVKKAIKCDLTLCDINVRGDGRMTTNIKFLGLSENPSIIFCIEGQTLMGNHKGVKIGERERASNTNVHISALNCYNRLFRKFTAHYC